MRSSVVVLLAVVSLFSVAVFVAPAQSEETPGTSHPIVGTWRSAEADASGVVSVTALMTFHADGTAVRLDADGTMWLGAWTVADSDLVDFTFESVNAEGSGMGFSMSASISDDGTTWRAPADIALKPGEGVQKVAVPSPLTATPASPEAVAE